jgi:hypothetical protein
MVALLLNCSLDGAELGLECLEFSHVFHSLHLQFSLQCRNPLLQSTHIL